MHLFGCVQAILIYFIVCNIDTSSCKLISIPTKQSSNIIHNVFREMSRKEISILELRGGQQKGVKSRKTKKDGKKGKESKGIFSSIKEIVEPIKPATRTYLALCLFCTVVHMIGLPAPAIFSLDRSRLWELWRPFTAVAYLGPPNMSLANNLYFLIRYGQTLESENGTGAHTWFLLVQLTILSTLGLLLGFPFQANAMVSAAVYVSAHMNPMERMPFQFGIIITAWQLPFAMMAIDCLSMQSPAAAWPHLLGIFSGHVYHFFTKV